MLRVLSLNNDGVVFVMVVMIIMIMIAIVVSMLGLNVSQVKTNEEEIRQIRSELLAEGELGLFLANQMSAAPGDVVYDTILMDSTVFDSVANLYNPGSGVFGTAQVNIDINY